MIHNSWIDYLYGQHIHRASTEELTAGIGYCMILFDIIDMT